ncbi:MAG: cytochrome c [Solirubrobacterales bacterium]
MSNETLLYVCGIILAVSAVGVSFVGLKVKGFPGKAMPLVVIWFAIFVGGSATFAVLHAKDEEAGKAKEAKLEEAGEKAEEEGGHVGPESKEGVEGNEEEKEEEAEENAEGFEEVGPEEGGEGPELEGGGTGEEGQGETGGAGGEEASGGDPEAGAEVFATNCSACHGEDGHGGAGGPDLTTMPKAQNEPAAIEQVTNGGGGMPPFGGQLSEEEIQNVAAFVVQKVVGNG